jgi:hypothetical protein
MTTKASGMKNSITLNTTKLMAMSAVALATLLSGCATPTDYSYNEQFRENLPTRPRYYVKDEDSKHFTIVVHQGSPSTQASRVSDLKECATQVANAETKRLGWEKWHLDYIQERDQGWMHIVIGKVTREVYGEQN